MVTITVPIPGSGSNVSKSGAMRLMPMMMPSTGSAAMRRVASASGKLLGLGHLDQRDGAAMLASGTGDTVDHRQIPKLGDVVDA